MTRPTELEISGRAQLGPDEWVLHFGYGRNPIPMNGPKGNWRARGRMTAAVKDQALKLAIYARIPEMSRCRAQLTWWVATSHKRDVDNLGLFEKPIYDALVLAGVVRDDTPEYMDKPRPVIRHLRDAGGLLSEPGFTLHVTRLVELEEIEL